MPAKSTKWEIPIKDITYYNSPTGDTGNLVTLCPGGCMLALDPFDPFNWLPVKYFTPLAALMSATYNSKFGLWQIPVTVQTGPDISILVQLNTTSSTSVTLSFCDYTFSFLDFTFLSFLPSNTSQWIAGYPVFAAVPVAFDRYYREIYILDHI